VPAMVHLEDVSIEGFKSFSGRTDMSFQPGVGVIIGNNGVGKSNILDALIWALGEDDLSRVRCYHRDELFFAGSRDYPAASRIRVELNLKQGEGRNAPTVRIVREMNRNGENRFYIQDEILGMEEYRRKLAGLDLRDSLKTIIRQEQINDILQLDPAGRLQAIREFLGNGDHGELSQRLLGPLDAIFQRYFSYLMPLAEVKVGLSEHNGQPGFEIEIDLPGNRRRRVHQLSGGEKSITSLALKLALFEDLQTPFFLLDEVEPSLDYSNHKSMQAFLKDVASRRQLIMITHLRSTIELANTLHGVRTRWDGSSFMKFYFVMDERLLRLYKCC
jgi:chromosome segregation ATPase